MNNKIRQLILVLGIMFVIGAATGITVQQILISQINQTEGNFTKGVMPLDYVINSTAGTWKQNANRSIELTALTVNLSQNTTGVLPNASIPASAMNVSQTRFVVVSYTRDTTLAGVQSLTGAGFSPTYVEIWAVMNGKDSASWGKFDGTTTKGMYQNAGAFYANSAALVQLFNSSLEVHANTAVFTADGMNITWAGDSPIGTAAMDVTFWR